MNKTIEAIYTDGVIKPLEKVALKDKEKVRITIVRTDAPARKKRKLDPHNDPLLNLIGDVSIGSLAQNIDRDLYGE